MKAIEKVLDIARAEVGYLEKKSNKELDSKTGNTGSNNYTKYARDLYPSLQGQPWCDMFVDWCFVQAFGQENAKILLCGGFSAYTPTSAQHFKSKGRYFRDPKFGDQIFFKNTQRINHTGLVLEIRGSKVRTVEGNTSGGNGVVANGGGVYIKEYDLSNSRIDGYGRPDYSLVEETSPIEETKKSGWAEEEAGWRYYLGDAGDCICDDWYQDTDGKWYWFNAAGVMVINTWYRYNGDWFYLGSNGAMVKGLQSIDGKWYYMNEDGKMGTEPITLEPDDNGALQYPGLAE